MHGSHDQNRLHPAQVPNRLRRRLLKVAFLPLLIMFPLAILLLGVVGGSRYEKRIETITRGNLATVRNYLDHVRSETENFVQQTAQSEALQRRLREKVPPSFLSEVLTSRASAVRLDFLVIADREGRVIAANNGIPYGSSLPKSSVLQQAITGVRASSFEVFNQEQLAGLVPRMRGRPGAASPRLSAPSVLVIAAAVPFPLSNNYPDVILYGGTVLNDNNALIDHIRDVTFPISFDGKPVNGIVTLFVNDTRVVSSLEPKDGETVIGTRERDIAAAVVGNGTSVVRRAKLQGTLYLNAYAPLTGNSGQTLGMIGAGIPLAPYLTDKWLLIGYLSVLMIVCMLGTAFIFERGTRGIVQRLESTIATMKAVHAGNHDERIPPDSEGDEIALLGEHFNEMLDELQAVEAERKLTQQAAENEAARRHALFDHQRDGLVLLSADGSVAEANQSILALLGYGADDFSRLHIRDWDARFGRASERDVSAVLAETGDFYETEHLRRDGSSYAAEVSVSAIAWGGALTYLLIIRDVTLRKEYEIELKYARLAAEAANRTKSEFLANMSHEIRTPMNAIVGMSQLMRYTPLTDEQEEYVDAITTSSDNLLAIINEILDLSKMESGKMELELQDFSLRECVGDVIKSLKTLAYQKGLDIRIAIPAAIPTTLTGDQLRLKQILLNLIGNAIKFTEKGEIRIGIGVSARQDQDVLLKIAITDTGIGISPEAVEKIFEPFTQADASDTRKYGGTGLGLTICNRLTKLMGGTIWVESEPGVGSTFFVELPFVVNEASVADRCGSTDPATRQWDGPPLRILLVDDQEINLRFMSRLLQRDGHTVITAEDGEEALTAWLQGRFDLIFMDIQMPVMDGIEATGTIRELERGGGGHTPVIALTARAMREEREHIMTRGFDGYVSKPIERELLLSEMRRCLTRPAHP